MSNWQNIIWREWRNSNNRDYADRLFDLVADEPAGWLATTTVFVLGTLVGLLCGAVAGSVVGLLAMNWGMWKDSEKWKFIWIGVQIFLWIGVGIGGAAVPLLMRWRLGDPLKRKIAIETLNKLLKKSYEVRTDQLTWRALLGMLVPGNKLGSMVFRLVAWLTVWLVFCGLVGFGLPRWPIVWLIFWLLVGVLVGHHVGPSGLVAWMVIWLVAWLFGGLALWLFGGLALWPVFGLVFALALGLVLELVVGSDYTALIVDSEKAYENRSFWFWWRVRPSPPELEEALRSTARK